MSKLDMFELNSTVEHFVFHLFVDHNLPPQEVAARLGLSVQDVSVLMLAASARRAE